MDKNKVIKNYSNYCQKCGWNISDEKIEKLRGCREQIYYCEQCGSKLLKREINYIRSRI